MMNGLVEHVEIPGTSERVIEMAQLLAELIAMLPASRERSLAVTKLEECVFWATRHYSGAK